MFSAATKTDNVSSAANYIEDVFSTYLYTGNGSTQTITNGIDLAGKGGLVWLKSRTNPPSPYDDFHRAVDTVRGTNSVLYPNSTSVADPFSYVLTSFNSNGFTIGNGTYDVNKSGYNYASWTFREQPKFFDVVTYTGDGTALQYVPHNLGSEPGCIIVKKTSSTGNWIVWHRSISGGENLRLNTAVSTSGFGSPDPLNINGPAQISVSAGPTADDNLNDSGATYVAYLFAHDAGGFGLTGTDNVISCGSYTQGSGDTVVTLGYEPQWVMIKSTDATGSGWGITDNMRAMPVSGSASRVLNANLSNAESSSIYGVHATATGFVSNGYTSGSFIYIAIRRGPMKTPTTGTSVYNGVTRTGTGAIATVSTTILPDMVISTERPKNVANGSTGLQSRLTGAGYSLYTNGTYAELDQRTYSVSAFNNASLTLTADSSGGVFNYNTASYIEWLFSRAPGFMDVVCYTGTGSATTQAHNLTVVPEMMIVKNRSSGWNWAVYHSALGNTKFILLDSSGGPVTDSTIWNNTSPTSTNFSIGTAGYTNANTNTYVAYLFATCLGVSKVGSYTGTGALQTVNCGFAAGSRFVLIKRTDSPGDWYVWDSARGISSGNDPYLLINSTAAEVTGTNYVDTTAVGFQVTAAAPAAINASGGTYIFLAIA